MKKTKKKRKLSNWTVEDFVSEVWKTMEEQAEKNRDLKMTHAQLEPEWNKVIQKITLLLESKDKESITKYTEDICKHGEGAVRPLIDALLKLKSAIIMVEKGDNRT